MEFRSVVSRLDGVLMVIALLGCIHAVTLSPTSSGESARSAAAAGSAGAGDCLAASDRALLEALPLRGALRFDNTSAVATDWGQLRAPLEPCAVLRPGSVDDVAAIVQAVARMPHSQLTVAARGLGSSVGGQSQAENGIVIEMTSLKGIEVVAGGEAPFVEAAGGELWVDVLRATLEWGLAPRSWTDYLYLTVGGTLSNAGVSGQTFRHGPEVSNVLGLRVVTGRGEVVDCSAAQNADLFFATLGGLGQFAIIAAARIALEPAPRRVRWLRALYTDFATFRADQELLVAAAARAADPCFDYVEGFVVVNDANAINGWGSVPFRRGGHEIDAAGILPRVAGAASAAGATGAPEVLYCLEVTKAYSSALDLPAIDQVVESMLAPLRFHRGLLFEKDTTYFKFLDRVHQVEMELRASGLWDIPHPWLNMFVPALAIEEFDRLVFKPIATQEFSGPILVYPVNKSKWDKRLSVAIPEDPLEEIFYVVAFLRNKLPDTMGHGPTLSDMLEQNESILRTCEPLQCKQYLPHYSDRAKWKRHFGSKWARFVRNKHRFDPCAILSPGLNIFPRACLGPHHHSQLYE